ncbi:hypothetical protein [Chondrinema litorale]|uniref:hypothetical protein n=1 Tax=Chondrinema litorale TaxID=2994555 RepID=UPI002543B557|nr:hypothetical protein [Chondrinema litorale]UZR97482.1 hypothetical protein OQ292_27125 [Chondrinema litorale]
MRFYFCICCIILLANFTTYGQVEPKPETLQDSVLVKKNMLVEYKDTLFVTKSDTVIYYYTGDYIYIPSLDNGKSEVFYDSLKAKSERSKISSWIYDFLISESKNQPSDTNAEDNVVKSTAPFEKYKGKIISSIILTSVPILEGSVMDTTQLVDTGLGKLANKLHVNTNNKVIKRNLIFKVGDLLSPTKLADNERIIRNLNYIQDARIVVIPNENNPDEVDVIVITQDKFSFIIGGGPNGFNSFDLKLGERNFLGSGRKVTIDYRYNYERIPASSVIITYENPNPAGTFFNTNIKYYNTWDQEGFELKSERNFITPQYKWIGGIEIDRMSEKHIDLLKFDTTVYQHSSKDVWVGRSFQIGGKESRKNFIISQRLFSQKFLDRPQVEVDSNLFYHDRILYLTGLSLTRQKFQKSTKILSFGVTEDLPTGYILELNAGYEFGEYIDQPYAGLEVSMAEYYSKYGYFYLQHNVGGYLHNRKMNEGVFKSYLFYFSPLMNLNRTLFRQFLVSTYTKGINRQINPYVDLSDNYRNIDLGKILVDNTWVVNTESVFFHPKNLYGFRIASYFFTDFGWLSTNSFLVQSKNFFSNVGVGFRIRNESLVFKTIQVSLGYFLKTPANKEALFYDFTTSDPDLFNDFRSLKPDIIPLK